MCYHFSVASVIEQIFMLDTKSIVARATPQGEGAIAIVRMSGSEVFSIADQCFKPAKGTLFF